MSMDSDLWDPPICEDDSSDFGGNLAENWLRTDFYDGYGLFDVMEEDALNEKACVQVRKIMFSAAEAKMKEVEAEITLLQSQLPGTDEVWSKKLSTLKEMMNILDALIQRLKNEEQQKEHDLDLDFQLLEEQQTEHELDFHLQSLEEHSEKLNKMLKDLLDSYPANIDVQVSLVQSSSPNIEKLENNQSNEETKLSKSVAIACGDKTLPETVGISCKADETRDVNLDQNGDAKSDLIASCNTHAADVPVQMNFDSSNIHMERETKTDSTTMAEKGVWSTKADKEANAATTNTSFLALTWEADSEGVKENCNVSQEKTWGIMVKNLVIESISLEPFTKPKETTIAEGDMLAVIYQGCTTDAAKQMRKESPLKLKLMMQEEASGINKINTGKPVDAPGKTTAESAPKENQTVSLISKSKVSDSDLTHGGTLKEPVSKKEEKAQLMEEVESSGVGEEPNKSNLFVRPGNPTLTEQKFSTDLSGMGLKDLKMQKSQRNTNLIIPDGHAGGLQAKYNRGADLNLKKDKGNSSIVDDNFDSVFPSLGKRMGCEAFPVTKKHVELKKPRINAMIDENVMSISVEEDEVTSIKAGSLLPSNFTPSSTMADYGSMTVPQLKAIAKERNLKRYSKLTKTKLIELLE